MPIRLDASLTSELNWVEPVKEALKLKEPIWYFDIGTYQEKGLSSYVQAIEYFEQTLYKLFPKTKEIILYQGSAKQDLSHLIDQLVAALPEDLPATVHFAVPDSIATAALLTSPERYPWVKVKSTLASRSTLGVLFPIEELCTPELLTEYDQLFSTLTDYRIVYEYNFTESWDGLDEVIVLPHALSPLGKRKLQGFEAAGGIVRNRGRGI